MWRRRQLRVSLAMTARSIAAMIASSSAIASAASALAAATGSGSADPRSDAIRASAKSRSPSSGWTADWRRRPERRGSADAWPRVRRGIPSLGLGRAVDHVQRVLDDARGHELGERRAESIEIARDIESRGEIADGARPRRRRSSRVRALASDARARSAWAGASAAARRSRRRRCLSPRSSSAHSPPRDARARLRSACVALPRNAKTIVVATTRVRVTRPSLR